jgi:hypothetical protein
VEQDFIAYKKELKRKMQLSRNLKEIRAELLHKRNLQKINFNYMENKIQDMYGYDTLPPDHQYPKNLDQNEKLHYLISSTVNEAFWNKDKYPIKNEGEQLAYEFEDKLKHKYFLKKFEHYEDTILNTKDVKGEDYEDLLEEIHNEEGDMEEKLEFMYNYMDSHNDRTKVREILAHELHKKTSIQDIGEMLDDIIIQYQTSYKGVNKLKPKALTEDITSEDLYERVKEITNKGKIYPSLYEDQARIPIVTEPYFESLYKGIIEKVDSEDRKRDHSKEKLNENEKLELQIFSTIKKDPYFKHYIFNCLREASEHDNSKIDDKALAIAADNYRMRLKFDPINIPVIEKTKNTQNFIYNLINGKAWGAGRKKTARAIA